MNEHLPERRKNAITIKRLLAMNLISILLGTAGLGLGIIAIQGRIDFVQQSRQRSATDNCYTLRSLVNAAFTQQHVNEANALLSKVGLGNCVYYGIVVRNSR